MTKVITYGTYDRLHRGHVRLLERAKALGDHLIVGITSDDYDKTRGKINAAQSLMERLEAVRATGLADEIVVEEYEGQKIDDIRRFGVDIFTVGSDWAGKFDYLNEYCKVVYLPRTEGVSSSEIRAKERTVRLLIYGSGPIIGKYQKECGFVNGIVVSNVCQTEADYFRLLPECDAIFLATSPDSHVRNIKAALDAGKHVLSVSPIALSAKEAMALFNLAKERNLILMDAIKTAYATAFNRMLLLVKSGKIGEVYSVDATCTSLNVMECDAIDKTDLWTSRAYWAPVGLLAVFDILGTDYVKVDKTSFYAAGSKDFDIFTKYAFTYSNAVASVKVGKGVKSEGDLVISGTQGYIYVPAPWWKTDYFEMRFENSADNRRYFYQLDGEGIRYELVNFVKSIANNNLSSYIPQEFSVKFAELVR